jgi:hypothetical protein
MAEGQGQWLHLHPSQCQTRYQQLMRDSLLSSGWCHVLRHQLFEQETRAADHIDAGGSRGEEQRKVQVVDG